MGGVERNPHSSLGRKEGAMHVTTLGIDLAKQVFQLHGVDARGHAVLTQRVVSENF
jgi:hypothetical protein